MSDGFLFAIGAFLLLILKVNFVIISVERGGVPYLRSLSSVSTNSFNTKKTELPLVVIVVIISVYLRESSLSRHQQRCNEIRLSNCIPRNGNT